MGHQIKIIYECDERRQDGFLSDTYVTIVPVCWFGEDDHKPYNLALRDAVWGAAEGILKSLSDDMVRRS